ncbi:DUF4440 domain-containing protein [Mesorhizobium sp. B2-4-6]|uniref:DUF4440 domain-containing protein n=1 Tax=Mesorhizobium sp. B2-4-6 TaxID=2589943 RepID=UPI00112EBC77|nr:DUF4440 domain-containing protein [Mesorhizobium sp. B2-4-6]TPL43602.1 DUF4440 domain-containing protein [Mesorhizobium sp. B2-4-6]
MSLFGKASAEILALHRFFVEWYDGATAEAADFGLFERAMGPGMRMIPPSGAVLDREAVVGHVRANRGAFDGDFDIEITDIHLVWEDRHAVLVTYVEWQRRAGARTARLASAFFTENPSAPNGVEWRHLHETWMQVVGSE